LILAGILARPHGMAVADVGRHAQHSTRPHVQSTRRSSALDHHHSRRSKSMDPRWVAPRQRHRREASAALRALDAIRGSLRVRRHRAPQRQRTVRRLTRHLVLHLCLPADSRCHSGRAPAQRSPVRYSAPSTCCRGRRAMRRRHRHRVGTIVPKEDARPTDTRRHHRRPGGDCERSGRLVRETRGCRSGDARS